LFAGLSSAKDAAGRQRLFGMEIDLGAHEIYLVPDSNGIVYVKETASGEGNGSTWENATSELHTAIHGEGTQKVFAAVGNYPVGNKSFIMRNNVEIYGGFDPDGGVRNLSQE